MDILKRQITKLSEKVKAVEGSLHGASAQPVKVAAFCSLLDEIKEITSTQTGVNPLAWDRSQHFGELLHWLAAMAGADVSRVNIQQSKEKGYGVCSTVDVSVEDEKPLLRIPLSCCITATADSSFIIGQCISAFSLPDNLKLMGILMSEVYNLQNSHWKAYLRSLPVSFSTILHMDQETLKILQGSLYHDDVLRRFCNMCKHYINCVAAVDLSKRSKTEKNKFASFFTFELFRWALDVLMTRGNALPVSERDEPMIALVPLLDMVNHAKDATKFELDEGDGTAASFCELRSTQSTPANSEVFMSYLTLSVRERFINHGFVTPHEGALQFPIDLNLSSDNPNRPVFEHLGDTFVQKRLDGGLSVLAEFSPDGLPSEDTLKILRMAVYSREGLAVSGCQGAFQTVIEPKITRFITILGIPDEICPSPRNLNQRTERPAGTGNPHRRPLPRPWPPCSRR